MKPISKTLMGATVGAILYASMCASTIAQDFYNGCRGPRALQIDSYVSHSNSEGKTNGTLISKLFTRNLNTSLPDLLLATPFSVSENGDVDNKGVNIGYIAEKETISAIGALGLFKDNEGEYKVLNPQIYLTHIMGRWTFDFESNLPIRTETHETSFSTSATLGYGISDRLRVGCSLTKENGHELEPRASMRFELREDHKYWAQCYIGENSFGLRFAINF